MKMTNFMKGCRRAGSVTTSSAQSSLILSKVNISNNILKSEKVKSLLRATAGDAEMAESSSDKAHREQELRVWSREQYTGDNSYAMNNKFNQEPNFLDPEWHTKVTDWSDFWNYQKWDLEVEGIDDEHDVGGNPLTSAERHMCLVQSIKDNRLRGDIMQWMPPENYRDHLTVWENPPVVPDAENPNPPYSHNDLRAISEKRRWKDIMDTEWRRRQGLVGRLTYPNPFLDVRLDPVAAEVRTMDWSEERIRSLITMDGLAADPEAHQAWVENPLVPCDYVQKMGVYWIEETEDFLNSIGHLATPEDEEKFDEEVILDVMDLVGLDESDLLEEALAMGEDSEDEEAEEGEFDMEDLDGGEEEEDGPVEVEDGDGF